MKWEQVYKVLDPQRCVKEVHVHYDDKELVMHKTSDGWGTCHVIDAEGGKTVYLPPCDTKYKPSGDFTEGALDFDGTNDYLTRAPEISSKQDTSKKYMITFANELSKKKLKKLANKYNCLLILPV